MQFLPEDHLTITTSLDGSTIKQRFTSLIVSQQTGLLRLHQPKTNLYSGNIIGYDLEFSRPAGIVENRYAPFVRGRINPTHKQTTITFAFHPNTATQAAFLTVVFFIVGLTVLVVASLLRDGVFSGFIIVAYMLPALLYGYHRSCFQAAVQKEKQFLKTLLADATEDEGGSQNTRTAEESSK